MTANSKFEFLTVDDVLAIAADQVERYGGAFGVRDFGLLESAVSAPLATFGGEYLYRDLCEFASAYLFSLAKNHPFVDGNKRTATAAALVFFALERFRRRAGPGVDANRFGRRRKSNRQNGTRRVFAFVANVARRLTINAEHGGYFAASVCANSFKRR